MNKKILIFITPIKYGGGETLLINFSKEFKKYNLDFCIINLAKSEEFERKLKENNINFLTIYNKFLGSTPSKKQYLLHLFRILPKIFDRNLRNYYKDSNVIWANGFPANFFVYFLKKTFKNKNNKKFIYTHHFLKSKEKGLIRKIYLKILSSFDQIVGVSSKTAQSLKETFPEIKDRIISIPNGIDLDKFNIQKDKNELRKELNLPEKDILGICVGRFTEFKNQIFLLDVLEKINREDFKIIFIGEGETKENFIEETKKRKLENRVIIKGFISNDLVPFYLKAADIFLYPSLKEGFGIVILEAMASGLPVVIFDSVYIEEFGKNILVAKNNQEFIKLTEGLVNDEKLRKEISLKLKEDIKSLKIDSIVNDYLQIFIKD